MIALLILLLLALAAALWWAVRGWAARGLTLAFAALLLFPAPFWSLRYHPPFPAPFPAGAALPVQTLSWPLAGVRHLRLGLAASVGSLSVSPGQTRSVRSRAFARVSAQFYRAGAAASLELRLPRPGLGSAAFRPTPWSVAVDPKVPLDLTVQGGVGQLRLQLVGLDLRDLSVRDGVGVTAIAFPRQGRIRARIRGGVGDLTLRIPAGLAVDLRWQPGMGPLRLPRSWDLRGSRYRSPGWSLAKNRLRLDLTGGLGPVAVQQ